MDPKIAGIIKTRRKQLHLTQHQAAELAGCQWKFIFDLEHGKETVRLDKFLAVLEALGLQFKIE